MTTHVSLSKLSLLLIVISTTLLLLSSRPGAARGRARWPGNVIDRCWRRDPGWRRDRARLAACSVGFAGKMAVGNTGPGTVQYVVTDSGDDSPEQPRPGTLRYGATVLKGKVWITFRQDMTIVLQRPLLVSSFTAIDGRGVSVHIAGNACLTVLQVRIYLYRSDQ